MLADVLSSVYTWTLLAISAATYALLSRRHNHFPVVNSHSFDPFSRKAHKEYTSNAHTLITKGLAKYGGPFGLSVPSGHKVVLPSSFTNWVKSHKDLDHRELVRQDFYAGLPGFEAQTALHGKGDMVLDVIRAKLGQNDSIMPILDASISKALSIHWGESKEWHTIDWHADTTGIITRAASSIFVGPEKAEDKEWLDLVQGYIAAYFTAVNELHAYPAWSRPLVQRFLPNAMACRKYTARARTIMNSVLASRQAAIETAKANGTPIPTFNDALSWTQIPSSSSQNGCAIEAGDIQLSLAMAALFTTSELFRQVLIDVASNSSIIPALRSEVAEQFNKHGITVAATYNMSLLDSVMKESQRLSAPHVALERVAIKPVTLPTSPPQVLPAGTHIMVDSTHLSSPAHFVDPEKFDAYRFLRKREAGNKTSQFAQASEEFSVFGGGRHLCPGRFFASNEVKMVMAQILTRYDVRLGEGYVSRPIDMGVYKFVDPGVRFEVRRRGGGE